MNLVALIIWLIAPTLALGQISYNPHQYYEGDPAVDAQAGAGLVAKKDIDGSLVYLKTDEEGRLITSSITGFGAGFTFGDVTSATTTAKVVRRTTYNEPTTAAQRSFASASANDTAAGTGARTLQVIYYDGSGNGPYTTNVTLNGTTPVNTSVSNIRFVDDIIVTTAGSGGVNAGIITMYNSTAGGGGTLGTVAAGANRTFWAHHYVPPGKIMNVTGISAGSTSTTVGCGALFVLKALDFSITNATDIQVSDFVRLYGQSSTFARSYQSPIKISGPARIVLWVTPECSSSTVYRAAIDFFIP